MSNDAFKHLECITETKKNPMGYSDDTESEIKSYNAWLTNKGPSQHVDAKLFANDVNLKYDIPKRAQFEYL